MSGRTMEEVKLARRLGNAAALVEHGVLLLRVLLKVVGFGRGEVREGFLHEGVQLAGLV